VREDPDVILVGEMRDRDTFEAGIHAAETGHLVFGTIHASSAPSDAQPYSRPVPGGHAQRDSPGARIQHESRGGSKTPCEVSFPACNECRPTKS